MILENYCFDIFIFDLWLIIIMDELKVKSTKSVIMMGLGICLGAFVYAYYAVCLSQLANMLRNNHNLTEEQFIYQLSVTTSLLNFGAFLSPVAYKKFNNYFGELKGLLLIDVLGIISIVLQLFKLSFFYIAIGRFILGLLMGLSTSIIPVYLNSISPTAISGKIGSYNQLNIVVGIMVAYLVGYIIDEEGDTTDEVRWRIFLGFPIIALIGRIVILQFLYPFNSIQYSIQQKKYQNIKDYCALVYENNSEKASQILIKNKAVSKQQNHHEGTWKKRIILAIIVITANQISGINAIFFYAKQLFTKITDGQIGLAQTLMFCLSIAQIISVLISSKLIDKYGRKKMILNGQKMLVLCLVGICVSDRLIENYNKQIGQICIVLLLFLHILTFNMTLGPICIIYCTEILEDITCIIITLKSFSLMMAVVSEYMIEYLGIGNMFLLFGVLTLLAFLFLNKNLMETQNLQKNQIYMLFDQNQGKSVKQLKKQKREEQNLNLLQI